MLTLYKNGWSIINYKDGSLELLKGGKSVYLQGDDSLPLRKAIDSYPYETAKYPIEQLVFEAYADVMEYPSK